LDELYINQFVYVPIKRKQDYNKKINTNLKNTNYIYSKVFNDIDRLFYSHKINKILRDIKSKINLENINLIHAHTLFSMGGIALKLKKEKNIDYIVAVRNTDVNLFLKYIFYLRSFGIKIMKESKKIIFLSPVYRDYVFEKFIPSNLQKSIIEKSTVVPNGIDPFFLKNKYNKFKFGNKKNIKLIYVGSFLKRKNVHTLIVAVSKLKTLGYKIKLTIIGGGGRDENKIRRLAKKNEDIIEIYDRIEDREKLLSMYRKSDIFIMISYNETFGLVYLEAMSQGLPIIYTRGEGIDGYFQDGIVGCSVNSKDINDILKKIEITIHNYNEISKNCYNLVENFSWNKIAQTYDNIYKSIY